MAEQQNKTVLTEEGLKKLEAQLDMTWFPSAATRFPSRLPLPAALVT